MRLIVNPMEYLSCEIEDISYGRFALKSLILFQWVNGEWVIINAGIGNWE